jgi:hypothetical protein
MSATSLKTKKTAKPGIDPGTGFVFPYRSFHAGCPGGPVFKKEYFRNWSLLISPLYD